MHAEAALQQLIWLFQQYPHDTYQPSVATAREMRTAALQRALPSGSGWTEVDLGTSAGLGEPHVVCVRADLLATVQSLLKRSKAQLEPLVVCTADGQRVYSEFATGTIFESLVSDVRKVAPDSTVLCLKLWSDETGMDGNERRMVRPVMFSIGEWLGSWQRASC